MRMEKDYIQGELIQALSVAAKLGFLSSGAYIRLIRGMRFCTGCPF